MPHGRGASPGLLPCGAAAAACCGCWDSALLLILAGTCQRDGHNVMWVICLEFNVMKSLREGMCFVFV